MGIRPKSVTVLAILGIAFAAAGILALLWSVASYLIQLAAPSPMLASLQKDPLYHASVFISVPLGLGLRALLLAASIASLKLRHWARRGMLIYAGLAILLGVAGNIFNLVFTYPRLLDAMEQAAGAGGPGAPPIPLMDVMRPILLVSGIVALLLVFIYPGFIFYFYTRPLVIDAFNGIFPAVPTNFPVVYGEPPAPGGTAPPPAP